MSVDVETDLQDLWVARRRRAMAELDYRRAVLRVMESGVSAEEVQSRLDVSAQALQGVLLRTRDTGVVPEGFSGASVTELCQRYEVGLLSGEQLVSELSAWPYELAVDASDDESDDISGGEPDGNTDGDKRYGTGEVPADIAARWFSDGALEQAAAQGRGVHGVSAPRSPRGPGAGVLEPSGFRVAPDGQWREVEDARDAGLLTQAMYRRVLKNVNPGISQALIGSDPDDRVTGVTG